MAGPFEKLEKCLDGASSWGQTLDCFYEAAKEIYEDFGGIVAPFEGGGDDDNGQLPDRSFADFTLGVHNTVKTVVLARANEKMFVKR